MYCFHTVISDHVRSSAVLCQKAWMTPKSKTMIAKERDNLDNLIAIRKYATGILKTWKY
jgi:hypothetical protein